MCSGFGNHADRRNGRFGTCPLPAALEIKDGGLYLMLEKTVKGSKLQQAELILGTMLLGLRSVEQDYSDYLKLTEREV